MCKNVSAKVVNFLLQQQNRKMQEVKMVWRLQNRWRYIVNDTKMTGKLLPIRLLKMQSNDRCRSDLFIHKFMLDWMYTKYPYNRMRKLLCPFTVQSLATPLNGWLFSCIYVSDCKKYGIRLTNVISVFVRWVFFSSSSSSSMMCTPFDLRVFFHRFGFVHTLPRCWLSDAHMVFDVLAPYNTHISFNRVRTVSYYMWHIMH